MIYMIQHTIYIADELDAALKAIMAMESRSFNQICNLLLEMKVDDLRNEWGVKKAITLKSPAAKPKKVVWDQECEDKFGAV